ncbi:MULTISPECIES: transketolase [Bifidobacterium]|uniref:Transketolase n=2 Tax=Bifidobacterium TaxID=1678 RepID=A0A556R9R8_9BIFI|nr:MULTISPECIES: transketolase [Bifidobacterium]MBI0086666.1 transketolase [Bifidobacterium sp. M0404]MBI0105812.1 transketolase [Bifidobacterium polysaccharolyticum]TSJ85636.1 transketolase [Bifidobacterium polysaccharolyticum]
MNESTDADKVRELKQFAGRIRQETIKEISAFGTGHVGGSLSIADLLAVLYGQEMNIKPGDPQWADRDWFVLSKGHCAPALYATLALRGYFPMDWLNTLNRNGTNLPSHADRLKVPGVDVTAGSLGQGASVAAGVALGLKMDGRDNKVYLVIGDGESQEGQIWEMALFAAQHRLGNLIAFMDYNGLQLDGYCKDICSLGDAAAKFEAFGWQVVDVPDGNDVPSILQALETVRSKTQKADDRPSMIVLHTVKGLGWSEIAGTPKSHSTSINEQQRDQALAEIQTMMNAA